VADAPAFDPDRIFAVLAAHRVEYVLIGGLAAALHGSSRVTTDADITPSREPNNIERLAAALVELDARIRTEGVAEGLAFDRSPALLRSVSMLNLVTKFGEVDLSFEPAGTSGYADLREHAIEAEIHGKRVMIAALADVIRSKAAANRPKDRLALPELRELLAKMGERK